MTVKLVWRKGGDWSFNKWRGAGGLELLLRLYPSIDQALCSNMIDIDALQLTIPYWLVIINVSCFKSDTGVRFRCAP